MNNFEIQTLNRISLARITIYRQDIIFNTITYVHPQLNELALKYTPFRADRATAIDYASFPFMDDEGTLVILKQAR